MKFILGKKLGMSQIFNEDGAVIPVTVIEAEPNVVTQVKTKDKDGYEAVQVKSQKSKGKNQKKEFKIDQQPTTNNQQPNVGDKIDVSVFSEGDIVKVSGVSKGKGFAGVMKRHNFSGMPFSHGHHHVARHGGSIGQRFPQHTLKGMRMAGRMGGVKATTRGLKVVKVDAENNLIAVKGAVPGNKGGLLAIQSQDKSNIKNQKSK
ncbi:MAG: 50S ribosomal protein L3 [Candidatus Yanofskybacteria bacterium]|nr:50S ribosomal protein L3 [Candidatus Yanofskybacteria bacterium]